MPGREHLATDPNQGALTLPYPDIFLVVFFFPKAHPRAWIMASEGQTVEVSNQHGPRGGVVFLGRPSSSVQALQRCICGFL